MSENKTISFTLGNLNFEYDENKNSDNIKKHGISLKTAARVFFDYDRIELYDGEHSSFEDRYRVIGDEGIGRYWINVNGTLIGNLSHFINRVGEILLVVYTDRTVIEVDRKKKEIIRIISARRATDFERRLYYGKNE